VFQDINALVKHENKKSTSSYLRRQVSSVCGLSKSLDSR